MVFSANEANEQVLHRLLQIAEMRTNADVAAETRLRSSGFLDSLGIASFLLEVERVFDVEPSEAELDLGVLECPPHLSELITNKIQMRGRA